MNQKPSWKIGDDLILIPLSVMRRAVSVQLEAYGKDGKVIYREGKVPSFNQIEEPLFKKNAKAKPPKAENKARRKQ